MNLQCPNCQKLLTVPEQYAGQLMKCPLCQGNFQVPSLPGGVEPAPAFAPPAPPPPSPPPPAPPSPVPPAPAGHDTYGVKAEPEPAPAFLSPVEQAPAFKTAAAEPAFAASPPAPPAPAFPATTVTPAPRLPPTSITPVPPVPSSAPPPPTGYGNTFTIWFSDKVLQWVPPVALVLVFILQFFTWVEVAPGGVPAVWQNAWQAAFGSSTQDRDMSDIFPILKASEVKKINESREDKNKEVVTEPSASWLTLFYLFPFFLVTLVATLAVAALPFVKVQLPPQVQQLMPWRWLILTGLNVLMLIFLGMQLFLNFDLESRAKEWIDNQPSVKNRDELKENKQIKKADMQRGEMLEWLQRTTWFRLVVLLHILATLAAALVYWVEKRGPAKPLPRIDLMW
jgi:hypothetical protein